MPVSPIASVSKHKRDRLLLSVNFFGASLAVAWYCHSCRCHYCDGPLLCDLVGPVESRSWPVSVA